MVEHYEDLVGRPLQTLWPITLKVERDGVGEGDGSSWMVWGIEIEALAPTVKAHGAHC